MVRPSLSKKPAHMGYFGAAALGDEGETMDRHVSIWTLEKISTILNIIGNILN